MDVFDGKGTHTVDRTDRLRNRARTKFELFQAIEKFSQSRKT